MSRFTRTAIAALGVIVLLGAFALERSKNNFAFSGGEGISIEGTSNVHGWNCGTETINGTFVAPANSPFSGLEQLRVDIPVEPLACGNKEMDRRMKRAMNVNTHTGVRYQLQFVSVANESGNTATLNTRGNLTINGTTKPVTMDVKGDILADGRIRFTGKHVMVMSDFGITPPTAMMGAMRTGDRVTVNFDVIATRQ
jgi:polyisoprenoid-binding protein YceI